MQKKIFKDIFSYFLGMGISQVFNLLRVILMPLLLIPSHLGIWSLMNVIAGYGANAHLGLLHGFNKELPVLNALEKTEEASALKNSIFWACLFLGVFLGIILFCFSFFYDQVYSIPLKIVSAIIILQIIYIYFNSLLRAEHKFSTLSKGIVLHSIITVFLIMTFTFVMENKLYGGLIGLAIAFMVASIYFLLYSGYSYKLSLDTKLIKKSFKIGLPLILIGCVDMFFFSIDRWIITYKLSNIELGYYAIALMSCNLLSIVPTSLSNVLYPRMLERFGETQDPSSVGVFFVIPIKLLSSVMIVLIIFSYVIMPVIVTLLLPKYLPSISLIKVLIPGAYFLAIASLAANFIISINKQSKMFRVQILAIIVGLIVSLYSLELGYGIEGVAYGTLSSYAIYGIGYTGLSIYYIGGNFVNIFLSIFPILILYIGISYSCYFLVDPVKESALWHEVLTDSLVNILKILGIMFPFLIFLNWNSGVFELIKNEIDKRKRNK